MTQCEMILDYLRENGSITPVEAMAEFGCMRLAASVSDLKRDGHQIRRQMVTSKNRYGEPVSFAKYELEVRDEAQSHA